jgi:hypothetical protein
LGVARRIHAPVAGAGQLDDVDGGRPADRLGVSGGQLTDAPLRLNDLADPIEGRPLCRMNQAETK